jgi:8-oxo-dGTP pyrophosphatase MutT (NUDIX family)
MNTPLPGPSRWVRGPGRTLARTRVLELREVRYDHPVRGTGREFTVIAAPDWVNVVALTPDGRLVLVRQFRFGIDDFSLEVPGGVIEPGEDPVAAGVRELAEETGFAGRAARLLGSVHPNPAIQDNRCHLVLVEDAVRRAALDWDPDEEIETSTAPVAEVLAWARAGRITHSLVLCALFHFEGWWRDQGGRLA